MDDISKKREAVMGAYPNVTWKDKVKLMSDAQVTAVYLRLKNQNKI